MNSLWIYAAKTFSDNHHFYDGSTWEKKKKLVCGNLLPIFSTDTPEQKKQITPFYKDQTRILLALPNRDAVLAITQTASLIVVFDYISCEYYYYKIKAVNIIQEDNGTSGGAGATLEIFIELDIMQTYAFKQFAYYTNSLEPLSLAPSDDIPEGVSAGVRVINLSSVRLERCSSAYLLSLFESSAWGYTATERLTGGGIVNVDTPPIIKDKFKGLIARQSLHGIPEAGGESELSFLEYITYDIVLKITIGNQGCIAFIAVPYGAIGSNFQITYTAIEPANPQHLNSLRQFISTIIQNEGTLSDYTPAPADGSFGPNTVYPTSGSYIISEAYLLPSSLTPPKYLGYGKLRPKNYPSGGRELNYVFLKMGTDTIIQYGGARETGGNIRRRLDYNQVDNLLSSLNRPIWRNTKEALPYLFIACGNERIPLVKPNSIGGGAIPTPIVSLNDKTIPFVQTFSFVTPESGLALMVRAGDNEVNVASQLRIGLINSTDNTEIERQKSEQQLGLIAQGIGIVGSIAGAAGSVATGNIAGGVAGAAGIAASTTALVNGIANAPDYDKMKKSQIAGGAQQGVCPIILGVCLEVPISYNPESPTLTQTRVGLDFSRPTEAASYGLSTPASLKAIGADYTLAEFIARSQLEYCDASIVLPNYQFYKGDFTFIKCPIEAANAIRELFNDGATCYYG